MIIDEGSIVQVEAICRDHYPLVEVIPFETSKGRHRHYRQRGLPRADSRTSSVPSSAANWRITAARSSGRSTLPIRWTASSRPFTTFLAEGADLITVTGGMSVDPDDVTPGGNQGLGRSGGDLWRSHAPRRHVHAGLHRGGRRCWVCRAASCTIAPASLTWFCPGCSPARHIVRRDMSDWPMAGLCVHCKECRYPDCGFGKGA